MTNQVPAMATTATTADTEIAIAHPDSPGVDPRSVIYSFTSRPVSPSAAPRS
jgi:hypothetical protein